MSTGPAAPLGRLHLIADLETLDGLPDALDRIRALLEAGLPSLSLRGPGRPVTDLVERGGPLRRWAHETGATFVVNGSIEAARELEADGVHLPARAKLPSRPLDLPWGVSVHDEEEITRADGARWLFLSPLFPTASKPGAESLGPERFATLARGANCPVLALGGIDRGNYEVALAAGAAGVAAIRGLLADDGPAWVRAAV